MWFLIVKTTDNIPTPSIRVLIATPTDTPLARIMQSHKQKCVRLVPNLEYKHIFNLQNILFSLSTDLTA